MDFVRGQTDFHDHTQQRGNYGQSFSIFGGWLMLRPVDARNEFDVYAAWNKTKHWVTQVLSMEGNAYDPEHVMYGIGIGKFQLWIGDHCGAITEVVAYPNFKAANIYMGFGESDGSALQELRETDELFNRWAKAVGCSRVRIIGRPGWAKGAPDFKVTANVFYKELQ